MFGYADWSDAGSATAMRNTKRFVKIQMANVGAVIAWTAKAALRIHIGAVHVNLAAVFVHDFANLADGRFENAVRARIRDHQRGEVARMRVYFRAEIGQIDIAIL